MFHHVRVRRILKIKIICQSEGKLILLSLFFIVIFYVSFYFANLWNIHLHFQMFPQQEEDPFAFFVENNIKHRSCRDLIEFIDGVSPWFISYFIHAIINNVNKCSSYLWDFVIFSQITIRFISVHIIN